MPKPRNDARLSPCEAFWQKHKGFLCEKPTLPCEHSAKWYGFFYFSYGYDFSCIGEASKNEVKAVIYSSFFTE